MLYLKRKIDTFLEKWMNDEDKQPLIVKGSRQIGKTASILHFAKEYYENIIYINFVEEPKYKNIVDDGYNTDAIIKNISRIEPSFHFVPHKTILIFDELQEFPEISTSLKFFKIDGRFDIICSGSLLGIEYHRIESNSVGYKTDYVMYSLDFEEFLWAKGYIDTHISELLEHMVQLKPFNDLQMKLYHSLFLDYCILGGMPAVVREYILNNTFDKSNVLQQQLILDYKEDIKKYAQGMDQTRILNVFNHIPIQLARENKKFQLTKVASNARFRDYRGCIEWLNEAGMIQICYCLNFPELPLKGNYEESQYKIYFSDTGLLVAMLDEEAQIDLRSNKNLGVYKGGLFENIIAEALVKEGYLLYYYKKNDSTLEQDFFIRNTNSLIPIEVKATNGNAKSLKTLIESEKYPDIHFGIKLSSGNIGYQSNIYNFPYFCTFLLKRYISAVHM